MTAKGATILLEDGTIIKGKSFGAQGEAFGEIVFNTSMSGYQEIISDPANSNSVIVMTYPEIGNYGINDEDFEGKKPALKGLVVKNYAPKESHYKSKMTLENYLKKNNVVAVQGVDTRALTRKIRSKGSMKCLITTKEIKDIEAKIEEIKTCELFAPVEFKSKKYGEGSIKIGVIDYGVKNSILEDLAFLGCTSTTLPPGVSAKEILEEGYDAVLLSSGCGDPYKYSPATVESILGQIPVFAIGFGAQILALAFGGLRIHKLKYGHRGANQPVIDLKTERVFITSQNHDWSVDETSLRSEIKATYKNLNDDTLEGFECEDKKAYAVEFYPDKEIINDWLKAVRK